MVGQLAGSGLAVCQVRLTAPGPGGQPRQIVSVPSLFPQKIVRKSVLWAALAAAVLTIAPDVAAQKPTVARSAVPETGGAGIDRQLAGADGTAGIIVTLVPGERTAANTDWNNPASVSELHRFNRALADQVLARLKPGDFKLKVRYDNFPGFAGSVTERGLAALRSDPAVASIEPDLIVHGQPAEGGTAPAGVRGGMPISVAPESPGVTPGSGVSPGVAARIAALEARVAALEKELKDLRRMLRTRAPGGDGADATGNNPADRSKDGISARNARDRAVAPETDRNR